MEHETFNLLSEDYTDVEYLELFGSEYLTLDNEYQAEVAIQKLERTDSPIQIQKAQAQYERESAAKLTRYSLEPTFTIPETIRAAPASTIDSFPVTKTPLIEEPPQEHVTKISNRKLKREKYRTTRIEIRRQRHINNQPTASTTTSNQK